MTRKLTTLWFYHCEQWRLGAAGRVDRMDFQISTDATSLTTGGWIDVDSLDCSSTVTSGSVGALYGNASANRTDVSDTIAGLTMPAWSADAITAGCGVYRHDDGRGGHGGRGAVDRRIRRESTFSMIGGA